MRTTKKERKENAKRFYNAFINGSHTKAALVIERKESGDSCKCRLTTVLYPLSCTKPIVIAEATTGVSGCFEEFLKSTERCHKNIVKDFWEEDFNAWLISNYGIKVTYNDGLVIMLERR